MSSNSEQEREKLKEEYKEHYRKIRDAKEKLRSSTYAKNVSDAIQKMNADDLLNTMDEFLGKVKDKMTHIEARLDVAMDQFVNNDLDSIELDEQLKKEKAADTLKQIKLEMGVLYSEIEHQAEQLNVEKTVGKKTKNSDSQTSDE